MGGDKRNGYDKVSDWANSYDDGKPKNRMGGAQEALESNHDYNLSHTYQQQGLYKIRIIAVFISPTITLGDGVNPFFGGSDAERRAKVVGIYMSEYVGEIKNKAISDYPGLKDLVLGSHSSLSGFSNTLQIGTHFGYGCSLLEYFPALPKTVIEVPNSYGQGCKSLEAIPALSEGVIKIWDNYFADCSMLSNASRLPATIVRIENYYFANCYALQRLPELSGVIDIIGDYYAYNCCLLKTSGITSSSSVPIK
jgi:hypothetical protein